MPATLYNDLYELFKEKYIKKLSSEEFVNMTAEEERNVFRTFIQGSKEAKKIIEDFNTKVQLKADEKVTEKTTDKKDFNFVYQGKTVNTASIRTIAELRQYQESFKRFKVLIEQLKSPTAEDIAQIQSYNILIADFERLITTRSKAGRTPAMQKSIDLVTKLQSMQEGIEQSTLGYMIKEQLHDRVSNVIAKLESKKYAYKNQGSINTAYYLTIRLENSELNNKVNLTEDNINSFIEELRTRNLPGFSQYTYNKLKENLVNILNDETNLANATNEDILNLIKETVSEETYEESRISGNYVDLQIKNLFDGQPVVFNEDNITKEAFDNLFGPKGMLTALKAKVDAGELYIVSQGIRVYDSELNIAGEIDLLMVDSTGQITIVDVKSGLADKWKGFSDANNANSKLENYQLQQTAYANLLQRMLGVDAKIAILPIQMDREDETGKILKAGKPTKKNLLTSDIFIELDKGPVQERINSIIPLKEVTPASTATDTKADVEAKKADIERREREELQQLGNIKDGDEVTYFQEAKGFTKGIVTDFDNGEFNLSYTNENEKLKSPGPGGIYNTTFVKAAIIAKYKEELAALNTTTDTKDELTNDELNAGPIAGTQTFNKPVSTKEEIKMYVAGPVLKASEIFWDKNIKTTGSWVPSIQDSDGTSGTGNYIEIEYDSLSEENKKIALELTEEGSFRTFDKSNSVRILIPGDNLSIEEIQAKSIEIANKFKDQDLLWYTPTTLNDVITNLEQYKKDKPNLAKEVDAQIQIEKDTWGQNLIGQYFDKATNTIWASEELYKKSKALPVKTTATDTTADLERKIKAFDKTIENEFEEGDYRKVLVLAEKQVKDGTILQTPENIQLLSNYPKLFEELIKATDARNKTISEFDKEKVLAGTPNKLPIYGIESSINPTTGGLEIKWVEVRKEAITNIQLTKIENYAASELINYKKKLQQELVALEATETDTTEDGEIIPSETEEITEVFIADSDRVTVAMVKDQLDKANTAEEVQTVINNLLVSITAGFVTESDSEEMVKLIEAKKEGLVVPQDMPIISESLEKGTELVAKKNIFTGAKNIVYATQDSILMVTNVDTVNKIVSVKALNNNKTIKIKFSDMNENFGLKTNLMNGTEKPDEPLTSEDKTFVSESTDLTTTFIEDRTKIEAIEKAASAKTIQQLEDDLLEDIFC